MPPLIQMRLFSLLVLFILGDFDAAPSTIDAVGGRRFPEQLGLNQGEGFVFDGLSRFQIPLNVRVMMVGLNGDGYGETTVDANLLETTLQDALSSVVPTFVETRKPLAVEFRLEYQVEHVDNSKLARLLPLLRDSAKAKKERDEDNNQVSSFSPLQNRR